MKSFLNVLYRRILYKIPLKWLLLGLVLFAVLLASFSSAESVNDLINVIDEGTLNLDSNTVVLTTISTDGSTYCLRIAEYVSWNSEYPFRFGISSNTSSIGAGNYFNVHKNQLPYIGCLTTNNTNSSAYLLVQKDAGLNVNISFKYELFKLNELLNTQLPVLTSLECQTQYSLIPISSVDENYCTTNNLCPSSSPSDCPNVGVSNLFINDVFHPGAFNVIMNIPEEIDWDYAYTNSGQNMNIDVVGYNVDYEKIDSIVAFQNYKPSGEDFQRIIGLLAPYTKIIVFFVFLFIIWAWIKKPFKSKKL